MRRGLWLAAGAVLGVAGYRRASRLAGGLAGRGSRGADQPGQPRGRDGSAGRLAAGQPAAVGPVSLSRPAPGRASTAARIGAAAGFVRDVRDGMAEYLELHHQELARNLESRSNRTSSG
jgi:hypothetical protein